MPQNKPHIFNDFIDGQRNESLERRVQAYSTRLSSLVRAGKRGVKEVDGVYALVKVIVSREDMACLDVLEKNVHDPEVRRAIWLEVGRSKSSEAQKLLARWANYSN